MDLFFAPPAGVQPLSKNRPLCFFLSVTRDYSTSTTDLFLHFPAPEILEWKPITLAADIWSLGVCTYVLLTGFSPFGGDTDEETYINIHQAALDFPPELFEGVSDMAKEFISECLVKDPK